MYALAGVPLAFLWCHLVFTDFAWQAWHNVWRPSGAIWSPPLVPQSPPLLRGRRGTTCIAKGSDVRPGVSVASLWRPSGAIWSPPLLRGRRSTTCTAKGSDVRPGVPLASLGLRFFCVAGVGQCALPRGRMYALASLSASFAWQAWDNVHCQGVGCTPWRPSGVPGSPLLLRGRRGAMCTACVAGVGQCALPKGWMHALASLWRPSVSASFAWQAWDNVHSLTHSLTHSLSHTPTLTHTHTHTHLLMCTHSLTHSLTLTHTHTHLLTHSLTHSPTHALTSSTHSLTHSPTHLLTHSLSLTNCLLHPVHMSLPHYQSDITCTCTYIHTHNLTHHHPSITVILPLPLLLFCAPSKSGEVVNMWGYPVL